MEDQIKELREDIKLLNNEIIRLGRYLKGFDKFMKEVLKTYPFTIQHIGMDPIAIEMDLENKMWLAGKEGKNER